MIQINELSRSYDGRDILKDIDIKIEKGTFTALLGSNGSGKSTLAKHLNAIIIPRRGNVYIDNMNTRDKDHLYDIRERVGIVFQNPDSQAVATIVEDDTAFAPENLGLSDEEILSRIDFALKATGIEHLRHRSISTLSGGQKQLTAISGILAMSPEYMVFDEGTSMLDPSARKRILDCVMHLRDELGITIIWITHYMDEAALADKVIVLNNGRLAAEGTPGEIFSDLELIENCGLELPKCAELCMKLKQHGYSMERLPLTPSECAMEIKKLIEEHKNDIFK